MQIVFAWIAILAMVRLALRLDFDPTQAMLAGLLLAAIPPFLVMASTAMPDMLSLALGFTGFERLLAWKQDERFASGLLASITLGLAPFARPHLTLLLPLGTLWLFSSFELRGMLRQLRREPYRWTPVFAAGCILIAVNQLTHDRGPALEAHDAMVGLTQAPRNLLSYLQYLAYPIPFALMWLAMRWREKPFLLLAPAIPIVVLHFVSDPDSTLLARWPFIASSYGITALVNMLAYFWKKGDWTDRLLGLWVLLPVPVVIYTHMPMKYMLGSMPAMILILLQPCASQ
jgi:hypothetical protein